MGADSARSGAERQAWLLPGRPLHSDFPAAVKELAKAAAEAIAGCCVRDDRYSKRLDPV